MSENEMGYRGSKSIYLNDFVKEQRVNGSWVIYKIKNKKIPLRCTLMGFERSYQLKILSNQINNINYYSISGINSYPSILINSPYFVTGFSDAESLFIILILK
jgi:hypothetical protein